MKITLNSAEKRVYTDKIVDVIPTLPPGTYQFKDFFNGQPTSARLGRMLYQDVVNNIFPNVKLLGKLAREGYII